MLGCQPVGLVGLCTLSHLLVTALVLNVEGSSCFHEFFLLLSLKCCVDYLCFITGAPFPLNFRDVVRTIFKRLFRVYAHIYHSHFQKIVSLKEEAHLNTCFKHFILFTHVPTCPSSFFFTLLVQTGFAYSRVCLKGCMYPVAGRFF